MQLERTVYTVSELNGAVRLVLSTHFGVVWVEGEISNLATPTSGHFYFSLKDFDAQVRCAMFKGSARGLGCRPANGMRVLVRAQVSLYEPRGDYQLVVDDMEEAGAGALRRAFEALKRKLAGEGIFDTERKRPIPTLPAAVGVITSPTGAAIRDILSVLKLRFPALTVIVYPVKVQGADAKFEIARALALANELKQCDVLILARGGGSLEDLWAFNEELVARAIFDSGIPVVSGIGHETDVTIADLVADYRAATPSAAAAAVSPDQSEWQARVDRLTRQLIQRMAMRMVADQSQLGFLEKRLAQAHPEKLLQRQAQRLDELEGRLLRATSGFHMRKKGQLDILSTQLVGVHPRHRLNLAAARFNAFAQRLDSVAAAAVERNRYRIASLSQRLQSISPLATLSRGYSITTRVGDGNVVRGLMDVVVGDLMESRIADGVIVSRVESTNSPSENRLLLLEAEGFESDRN